MDIVSSNEDLKISHDASGYVLGFAYWATICYYNEYSEEMYFYLDTYKVQMLLYIKNL